MSVVVTFEPKGALYVQFRDAKVAKSVELVENELIVDLDEFNNVLGIEALRPGTLGVFMKRLPSEYRMPEHAPKINFKRLEQSFAPAWT